MGQQAVVPVVEGRSGIALGRRNDVQILHKANSNAMRLNSDRVVRDFLLLQI